MEDKIIGRNPVMEAIRSDREIDKILIKKGAFEGSIVPIIKKAKEKGIIIQETDKQKLDQLADGHLQVDVEINGLKASGLDVFQRADRVLIAVKAAGLYAYF